jgi:hypothetical protein
MITVWDRDDAPQAGWLDPERILTKRAFDQQAAGPLAQGGVDLATIEVDNTGMDQAIVDVQGCSLILQRMSMA